MNLYSTVRFVLIGFTILILGALVGWYIFLRTQHSAQTTVAVGRGLGDTAPSFSGAMGSNYQNSLATITNGSSSKSQTVPKVQGEIGHVSETEVAGFGFVTGVASTTSLYFVERATGYVFSSDIRTGGTSRISGVLTPKIYEALVARDGSVIERYPSEKGGVETVIIAPPAAPGAVARRMLLPQNISPLALSPEGVVVYGTRTATLTTLWSTNVRLTKAQNIFQSPIASWDVVALGDGRIVLTEKAADAVSGHSYIIDKKGVLSPLVSTHPGLTVLAQSSSTALLYTTSSQGKVGVYIKANGTTDELPVPLSTVSEKCAWTPASPSVKKPATSTPSAVYCAVPDSLLSPHFLDSWYRGEIHTTDSIWRIDPTTGTATKITVEWPRGVTPPDVINPHIDSTGTYLAFKDARDQSLWVLRLQK